MAHPGRDRRCLKHAEGRPEFGQALSVVLSLLAWVLNVYRALETLLLSLSPTPSLFPTSDARPRFRRLSAAGRNFRQGPTLPRLVSQAGRPSNKHVHVCTRQRRVGVHRRSQLAVQPPIDLCVPFAEPSLSSSARVDPFFLTAAYPAPLQKGPPPSA